MTTSGRLRIWAFSRPRYTPESCDGLQRHDHVMLLQGVLITVETRLSERVSLNHPYRFNTITYNNYIYSFVVTVDTFYYFCAENSAVEADGDDGDDITGEEEEEDEALPVYLWKPSDTTDVLGQWEVHTKVRFNLTEHL